MISADMKKELEAVRSDIEMMELQLRQSIEEYKEAKDNLRHVFRRHEKKLNKLIDKANNVLTDVGEVLADYTEDQPDGWEETEEGEEMMKLREKVEKDIDAYDIEVPDDIELPDSVAEHLEEILSRLD
jgi:molybdenum-dependent DNA-binding transcriptional regulator ModE